MLPGIMLPEYPCTQPRLAGFTPQHARHPHARPSHAPPWPRPVLLTLPAPPCLPCRAWLLAAGPCRAALNYLGSKLPHTCASPNTYYQSFRGRCCHVALRDIAAGELLTTSYMPAQMNIMSTTARCGCRIPQLIHADPCCSCAGAATAT